MNSKLKPKTPLGLYIHVPFCRSKCVYCDFYSLPTHDEQLHDEYLTAICKHIRETGPLTAKHRVDTIYFGGGTPTFFGADGMAAILMTIRKSFDVAPDAEITFEANPDSVDEKTLRRLWAEGFNRASLGIQCDDDQILHDLGRPHTYDQAVSAVKAMRKAGFDNISVDLMYGLPGQGVSAWCATVMNIISLRPDHISCYGLKVEAGTPLYEVKNLAHLPDDDTQADMYLAAVEILKSHGYRQYEISNFSKRGKTSKHNMKYWTGGEYIGFGPDASSDFGGKRYSTVRSLEEYVEGIATGGQILRELSEIPVQERAGEYLMLRLRTVHGISAEEYESRYLLPFAPLEEVLRQNEAHGLAKYANRRWHLTPKGMLVSNSIISDLQLAQENSEPLARKWG